MAISSRSKSSFSVASYMIFLVLIVCFKLHFIGESCKQELTVAVAVAVAVVVEDLRGRGHNNNVLGKRTGTEHKPNHRVHKDDGRSGDV